MQNQHKKDPLGDYCFLRQDFGPVPGMSGRNKIAENEAFMQKINCIIDKNIGNSDFSVDALGEELGISRVQLFRRVKELTGKPPVVLIRKLRMIKAAELIDGRAGNIAEISLSIGLLNPSYFSKRFREFYGSSPKSFIRHCKESTVLNPL